VFANALEHVDGVSCGSWFTTEVTEVTEIPPRTPLEWDDSAT